MACTPQDKTQSKYCWAKRLSIQELIVLVAAIMALCATHAWAQTAGRAREPAVIQQLRFVPAENGLQLQISVNRRAKPEIMTLKGPDRLVLDFKDTTPGRQPQRLEVNRQGVKAVRIGQDGASPPTTRIVLDLSEPQDYKLIQDGNQIELLLLATMHPQTPILLSTNDPVQKSQSAHGDGIPANDSWPRSFQSGLGSQEAQADSMSKSVSSDPGDSFASDPGESSASQGPAPTSQMQEEISTDAAPADPPTQSVSATKGSEDLQLILPELDKLPLQSFPISALLATPSVVTVADLPGIDVGSGAPEGQAVDSSQAYSENLRKVVTEDSSHKFKHSEAVLVAPGANDVPSTAPPTKEFREKLAESGAKSSDESFVLGPGDVLAINVWKEPDISRVIPVRSDGKISLPLAGELQASGQTPRQLETTISKALQAYISEPDVAVIVQQIKSRHYNVLGQVAKPGSYLLLNSATVLDAIAVAGGFRDFAKKKSIYILRENPNGGESRIRFNYDKVIKGIQPEQNITLQPGDTLVVP